VTAEVITASAVKPRRNLRLEPYSLPAKLSRLCAWRGGSSDLPAGLWESAAGTVCARPPALLCKKKILQAVEETISLLRAAKAKPPWGLNVSASSQPVVWGHFHLAQLYEMADLSGAIRHNHDAGRVQKYLAQTMHLLRINYSTKTYIILIQQTNANRRYNRLKSKQFD